MLILQFSERSEAYMAVGDVTLKCLQEVEFEALLKIKSICEENKIKFFLRGGSVLGAVKYQGFVPWDDDIDIALPRKDYLKLIEVMPRYFGEKFQFVCYQKVKDAHCYFPRVLLQEEYREKMYLPRNNERGLVLMDVLPIDGMPNGNFRMKLHIVKAYFYRLLASLWTLEVKDTVSMHEGKREKILKLLYALRIHHFYRQDDIYRKLDKMYAKYTFGETNKAGMLASSKLKKEVIPSKWWGKGVKTCFNGINVYIPSDYDNYLKQLFGSNYATTEPTIEERTKSHLTRNRDQN